MPWFICGDFNEILSQNEKRGGNARSEAQINKFRPALKRGVYLTWIEWTQSLLGVIDINMQPLHWKDWIDVSNRGWLDYFNAVKIKTLVAISCYFQVGNRISYQEDIRILSNMKWHGVKKKIARN